MKFFVKRRITHTTLIVVFLTLLPCSSLFAQHRVTMTTEHKIGDKLNRDDFWVNEDSGVGVTIVGLEKINNSTHKVTSQNIEITGNITELNCGDIKLTALDVTEAPELTNLDCRGNKLPSLDVSKNTKLTYLACGGNLITSISLPNHKALKFLNCSRSPSLSNVDLSGVEALKSLYIHNCPLLESVDLSKSSKLEIIHGFESNLNALDVSKSPLLETLNIYGNKIKKLDLTENHKLITLSCYQNELESLLISSQAPLNGIHIYHNKLDRGAMFEFIQSLPKNTEAPINIYVIDKNTVVPSENVCSNTLVSLAKKKGFVMYDFNGSEEKEYLGEGEYPTLTFTTEIPINETLTMLIEGEDALVYDGLVEVSKGVFKVLEPNVLIEGSVTKLSIPKAKLTALETSLCPTLSLLDCSSNALSSLDLSNNEQLKEVRCEKNLLAELRVTPKAPLLLVHCHKNAIKGKKSSLLIGSLPSYKDTHMAEEAQLCIITTEKGENNAFLEEDIAMAREKRWKVYRFNGTEYELYTSIEEIINSGINIAFDKERKEFSIENLLGPTEIVVWSLTGEVVYRNLARGNATKLNLDFLPSGVYLLSIGKKAVKIVL